jgi:NitT/TauT family transport system substrate-binding protein
VVSRKFLEARPNDVQALVDAWFDTLHFMRRDQAKAYGIMAKRAGVSVDEYRQYDAGTRIFTIDDNLKAFTPGSDMSSLPHAAGEISRFLVESGNLKQAPSLGGIFDDRFVKAHAAKNKAP